MNDMPLRELWIKKPFFQMIKEGTKTAEGRLGYPGMRKIKTGSTILLLTGDKDRWERNRKGFPKENMLLLKVAAVRTYKNFEEALRIEKVEKLLPGYTPENALSFYNQIFPWDKVKQYGVIIFELQTINQK